MAISVTRPSIRRKDMDSVLTCMVSDQLGPGVRLEEFTTELAKLTGGTAAVAVREYERAIDLAFEALGLVAGDSVVISPLAPAVYADVMVRREIVPLFAKVDVSSGNLDLDDARVQAGEDAKALVLHSPLGAGYSASKLEELALPVIEDASHGFGAGEEDSTLGTLGNFTVLSLEPDSIFTTGGGAAVVARSRSERTALKKASEPLRVTALLPDMNAALGLAQLRALSTYISRRREVADIFRRSVMQGRHKTPAAGEYSVPFAFPVLLEGGAKEVISYARKKDVEAVWAFAESIMAVADSWDACSPERFPNASALLLRCIVFPLYPTLTKADIERIAKVLGTLP